MRQLVWMTDARLEFVRGRDEADWMRTSFLLAEIYNSGLALVCTWGGGSGLKAKSPLEMNPTISEDERRGKSPTQTEDAFAFARKREEAKRNGKQV